MYLIDFMCIIHIYASIFFFYSPPVNSNASDVDIKPKLSDAHMMGEAEGSLISQEGEEVQVVESGKSTPMVSCHNFLNFR